MFMSLSSRIAAVGVLVVGAILALVVAMVDASRQSRESFRWVTHSGEVIQTMEDALSALQEAEAGQRGFILTRNPGFALSFDRRIEDAQASYATLHKLTQDNSSQTARVEQFGRLLEERIELLRMPLELARNNDFEKAENAVVEARGLDTMMALAMVAQEFLNQERVLQQQRILAAERRLAWGRGLALYGGPLIALFSMMVSLLVIRGIHRPVHALTIAMTRVGAGNLDARVDVNMGSREFNRLAKGYNSMVSRLAEAASKQTKSETELKKVHDELLVNTRALQSRGEVIELLGAMSHRMQATRTDEELADVISIFVPRVMPGIPGALYAHNNSRNLLVSVSSWGGHTESGDNFAPENCWALRRGQSHYVSAPGSDVSCKHVGEVGSIYHCEPLLASGEVIGVLHLDGNLDKESRFRMGLLSENIASAMVNRRLQRDLKEQTIRDPLTSLFNRRYMEEALALEVARAGRSGSPLCVVMCDVDHFKRFNDEFGHDAGDVVLQAVATVLGEQFRDGDIVCRYGGEEFTIIAPGTTQADLIRRVETVRLAIAIAAPQLHKKPLGNVTMSFGVAQWNPGMDKEGSLLVAAADSALYRAKREGRNRVIGYHDVAKTSDKISEKA